MTSPYISKLKQAFDLHLIVGEETSVNFLLQYPLTKDRASQICAVYDKDQLEVSEIKVITYTRQTLVSTKIKSKDLGSLNFSLSIPHRLSLKQSVALETQLA